MKHKKWLEEVALAVTLLSFIGFMLFVELEEKGRGASALISWARP